MLEPRLGALAAIALGLALAAAPSTAAPAPAPAETASGEPEARYDSDTRALTLNPPPGAAPIVKDADGPPRIVVEWPGWRDASPRALLYGAGPVYRFSVELVAGKTRVTLFLRQKLDGGYKVVVSGAKTVVQLTPDDLDAAYVRPLPRRTPRPAPIMPLGRITPAPVFPIQPTERPPMGWAPARPLPATPGAGPTERLPMADPFPGDAPGSTPAPALPQTPVLEPGTPAPAASAPPTPAPTATPEAAIAPDPAASDHPVFGSRLYVGADVPVGVTERYPAGGVDASIPWSLGGGLGWDHLLSDYFGVSIAGRATGYALTDEKATNAGFEIKHRRDDYELGAGVRGRLPLGYGFEAMLQPGLQLRYVNASTSHAVLAGGVAGDAVVVPTTDYLSASWFAFGPAVRGGLGWRLATPFALAAFGEYRYMATGTVLTSAVPAFFPLTGWRAGGEAQLDFGAFGLTFGYALGADGYTGSTADGTLDMAGGAAYARMHWLY